MPYLSYNLLFSPMQRAGPGDPIELSVVALDELGHNTSAFLGFSTMNVSSAELINIIIVNFINFFCHIMYLSLLGIVSNFTMGENCNSEHK